MRGFPTIASEEARLCRAESIAGGFGNLPGFPLRSSLKSNSAFGAQPGIKGKPEAA